MRLLPTGFEPRSPVSPTLLVSPLLAGLQERLEWRSNETKDLWMDDIRSLLNYDHLGYLYARFLGPDGTPTSSAEQHPLWTYLADIMEEQDGISRIYPQGRTTPSGDHPLLGLSNLVCDIRQQMATAIENLWTGPLISTTMNYLLRFSLRFRLSPLREEKYFATTHTLGKEKNLEKMNQSATRYSRKAWKGEVERSQNILGRELQQTQSEDMDLERFQHLLSFQRRHAKSEPERIKGNLSFQDRLTRQQCSHETTTPAPHEDLDEASDQAEQEQEQQQFRSGKTVIAFHLDDC